MPRTWEMFLRKSGKTLCFYHSLVTVKSIPLSCTDYLLNSGQGVIILLLFFFFLTRWDPLGIYQKSKLVFLSKEELKEMEHSVHSENCKTKLNNKNGIGRSVHFIVFYLLFWFFFRFNIVKKPHICISWEWRNKQTKKSSLSLSYGMGLMFFDPF